MDPETRQDKIDFEIRYLRSRFNAWLQLEVRPEMLAEVSVHLDELRLLAEA